MTSLRSLWLRLHRWFALGLGWILILTGLTGTLLIIGQPLDRMAHPELFQARTTHVAVFHGEPQWLNQVQAAAGVGAKADHIAGIGGDFWLDQDDVEHGMQ